MFALSLCIAHILACGWYYLARNSSSADNWLRRYNFVDEAWYDRYWASLYFIYTTFTTTGYGDIVPYTSDEFVFTIFIVCLGVSFYSYVFSHMMIRLNEYNVKNGEFNTKKLLLKQLATKHKVIGKTLQKEMTTIIEEHKRNGLTVSKVPKLKGVKPYYITKLFAEVCKNQHQFHKISFFEDLPKKLWVEFFENMEERIYLKGEVIYESGSSSGTFYVVKRGKVWLMTTKPAVKNSTKPKISRFAQVENNIQKGDKKRPAG